MTIENKRPHCVALFSGGLDSSLAVLLMLQQNIEVTAIMFLNHFGCDISDRSSCGHDPYPVAKKFGFKVKLMHLGEKFVEIVKKPKYGHGKNMNPCVDCRILMLREAKEFMDMVGADFIITGEVMGQRPKSQKKNEMNTVIHASDLDDILLRPLSAKLLAPTKPEREGLVDRDQLMAVSGRSRKPQMKLAKQLGLDDYPAPAAGCLLTDRGYSIKLKDLLDNQEKVDFDEINLLRLGRQFRLSPNLKIIVGRDENENNQLEQYTNRYDVLEVLNTGSPLTLLCGEYDEEELQFAAAVTARYCGLKKEDQVEVTLTSKDKTSTISVKPAKLEDYDNFRLSQQNFERGSLQTARRINV